MQIVLAALAGLLMAASVWLLLSGNLLRMLFGLVLLGNVANLVIFAGGGLTFGEPALVADGATVPNDEVANALPQALILTAIVISFALLVFAIALVHRAHGTLGTVEVDRMRLSEQDEPAAETPPVEARRAA